MLASFGSSQGYSKPIVDVEINLDPSLVTPDYQKPLRYGKLPEIHHIFRQGPKNPNAMVSIVFAAAVAATIPALFLGVSRALGIGCLHYPRADMVAVVSSGCQPFAPAEGFLHRARLACSLLWLCGGHGARLLPVLHQLEPLPDAARGRHCRCYHFSERHQGAR